MNTKTCATCEKSFPATPEFFHRYNPSKDGLRNECKPCRNKRATRYYHSETGKQYRQSDNYQASQEKYRQSEKRKAARRRYEQSEKGREANRRKRINSPEKYRGITRRAVYKFRKLNPELSKEQQREYVRNNSDKVKKWAKKYRTTEHFKRQNRHRSKLRKAIIKQAQGSYSLEEWEELCRMYDYKCLACGETYPVGGIEGLTVDHVIPLSKNGSNDISNIQPLCHSCNSSKGDKIIDYRSL